MELRRGKGRVEVEMGWIKISSSSTYCNNNYIPMSFYWIYVVGKLFITYFTRYIILFTFKTRNSPCLPFRCLRPASKKSFLPNLSIMTQTLTTTASCSSCRRRDATQVTNAVAENRWLIVHWIHNGHQVFWPIREHY